MPGLKETVSNANSPVASKNGNERKIPPERGSVTISPTEPQAQDINGAGPFRNGLMPSPSQGPSNVVRLETEGVTIYTTVDAVKEIQQEQKYNSGYTKKSPTKEPPALYSVPERHTSEDHTSKGPTPDCTPEVKPAVEKKRNHIAEWFNRFKDQEPARPKVDDSVNLNPPTNRAPPSNKPATMGPSTLASDNIQRARREPVRPPNSEDYTFTPRLPPPSETAFVYRQDDIDKPEDAHTNNPDAPPKFAPNRLLTIDMNSDTTALSPRAIMKLVEVRKVATQQATIRLHQTQVHPEGKFPQSIGNPPLDQRDAAIAIRLLQAQARLEAKQAAKEAAKEAEPSRFTVSHISSMGNNWDAPKGPFGGVMESNGFVSVYSWVFPFQWHC